jgi:hypothetical protein
MNVMPSVSYFLLSDNEREVIVHKETGLRVNVFNLKNEDFEPTPGELHVFGEDTGMWLAFETEGWTTESLSLISAAVLWYAYYVDAPSIKVTIEDPRTKFYMSVVY